jgi:hypothetical protein
MGRKSSSKSHGPQTPPGPQGPKASNGAGAKTARPSGGGLNPLVIAAVVLAVIGVGALAFWNNGSGSAAPPATAATADATAPADQAGQPAVEKAAAQASLGPRKQASFPPIPFAAYAPPRSHEVITAAYHFAADHPEILSYVPCFCGCERSGHGANHDCFIRKRDAGGDVVEWDEHGVECAVCIDVANRSRQMHASGASVRDIRTAIDKEFGARVPTEMHTPHPPSGGAHGAH